MRQVASPCQGKEPFLSDTMQSIVIKKQSSSTKLRKLVVGKPPGKTRTLLIPCIRDRVVQGAVKIILEAIFEADFCPNSYWYRPKRSPHQALAEVRRSLLRRMFKVIEVDLSAFFDSIRHHILLAKIARRVQDDQLLDI